MEIKPTIVLPKGAVSRKDIKELRANGLCVIEAEDPSAVRFLDAPIMASAPAERAAVKLVNRLLTGEYPVFFDKSKFAALIVLESEPPTERWFIAWEDWFVSKVGERQAESVRQLFRYARLGVEREQEVRTAARTELADMLESLARQIKPIGQETAK